MTAKQENEKGNFMTAKRNDGTDFPTGREPLTSPALGAYGAHAFMGRRRQLFVLGVAVLAVVGLLAWVVSGGRAHASAVNCAATPSTCGYPDATNTGVPSGTTLSLVPSQVSSGPGWYYNATGSDVIVNVNGTVLSGLSIPYDASTRRSSMSTATRPEWSSKTTTSPPSGLASRCQLG